MNINDRIKILIKELGLNNNSFAKSLGINPAVTFNIIEGRRTKPSYDLLEKIITQYSQVNIYWLLKEQGEMFSNENNKRLPSQEATHEQKPEEDKAEAEPQPASDTGHLHDIIKRQDEYLNVLKDQLQNASTMNQELMGILKRRENPR